MASASPGLRRARCRTWVYEDAACRALHVRQASAPSPWLIRRHTLRWKWARAQRGSFCCLFYVEQGAQPLQWGRNVMIYC